MPTITYVTKDGVRHDVDVETGYSVMEGAVNNDIEGIVAEGISERRQQATVLAVMSALVRRFGYSPVRPCRKARTS